MVQSGGASVTIQSFKPAPAFGSILRNVIASTNQIPDIMGNEEQRRRRWARPPSFPSFSLDFTLPSSWAPSRWLPLFAWATARSIKRFVTQNLSFNKHSRIRIWVNAHSWFSGFSRLKFYWWYRNSREQKFQRITRIIILARKNEETRFLLYFLV